MSRCCAVGCRAHIPPRRFLCARHLAIVPDGWDPKTWFHAVERLVTEPGSPAEFHLKAAFIVRHLALVEKKNPSDSIFVQLVESKRRERLADGDEVKTHADAVAGTEESESAPPG